MSLVPLDSVGSITVTCVRNQGQPTASVLVTIGPSQNTGAINVRKLRQQAGADLLEYNLFSDPGRSAVWGTGNQAVVQQVTVPPPVGSAQQVFQIYGRIPPAQNVSVGNYSDTLTLTVNP